MCIKHSRQCLTTLQNPLKFVKNTLLCVILSFQYLECGQTQYFLLDIILPAILMSSLIRFYCKSAKDNYTSFLMLSQTTSDFEGNQLSTVDCLLKDTLQLHQSYFSGEISWVSG